MFATSSGAATDITCRVLDAPGGGAVNGRSGYALFRRWAVLAMPVQLYLLRFLTWVWLAFADVVVQELGEIST